MLRAALPCALAAAAAADSITLQPCLAGFAAGSWQKLGGGLIGQVGTSRCITAAATGPLGTAPCDPSNAAQQFNFNADGTVAAAGFPGNCWNVWGGATGANTPIELYACGSLLAANDVFAYLPTSQQIFANESELCLATAPPPPGLCASDADCNLNGQCNNGTCTCYTPWAGLSCGVLDLQPVPTGAEGYGMSPNLTSWGGNVVFYEVRQAAVLLRGGCLIVDAVVGTAPLPWQRVSTGHWRRIPPVPSCVDPVCVCAGRVPPVRRGDGQQLLPAALGLQ